MKNLTDTKAALLIRAIRLYGYESLGVQWVIDMIEANETDESIDLMLSIHERNPMADGYRSIEQVRHEVKILRQRASR